ncbi:peptidase M23 [Nonlabens spongiae]|uniref:Peptidase M23 n=1 Tax=Nonlabens spongiae TaxID=331648 RepID=A0A1W6MLS1_9FLAO|nr:M23 family metallopeptidase [Nonlabens spongiae]ARN78522.1 peptidase M23 [Nonlabens spongiae]
MAKKKKKKGSWTHRYRMVVLNDDTFEERISLKLSKLNVVIVITFIAAVLIALTALLIAYTPLREYIPGYSSADLRRQAQELYEEADSLKMELQANDAQYERIKMVLNGNITSEEYRKIDSVARVETQEENPDLTPIAADSLLRKEVEAADRFNVIAGATAKTNFVFFPPVKGQVTQVYDESIKHFAVDVVTPPKTPIKAAADGTVIFSGWTADTGYTILIEHSYGLITVYKHAASLSKEQNDQVLSGEVIGIVGNTGDLTTGPHLHFELWSDGYPLDPLNFISFE